MNRFPVVEGNKLNTLCFSVQDPPYLMIMILTEVYYCPQTYTSSEMTHQEFPPTAREL